MEHKYHPGMEIGSSKWQKFLFAASWKTKFVVQDIKYAAKLLCGMMSGYDGLQVQFNGNWEYIAFESTKKRKIDGSYVGSIEFEPIENPHYVCIAWQNKSHTPLPVVLDDAEYPIQKIVVRLFDFLWNHAPFCPEAWRAALTGAAQYKSQYENK